MINEHSVRTKIRDYVINKYDTDYNASIVLLEKVEEPNRFDGPVYLAVVNLKALEEQVLEALANCLPESLELMQRHLARGNEVTCVFSSSGEEIERHCRGCEYHSNYRELKI